MGKCNNTNIALRWLSVAEVKIYAEPSRSEGLLQQMFV
jgi:hypothetical protein